MEGRGVRYRAGGEFQEKGVNFGTSTLSQKTIIKSVIKQSNIECSH